MKVLMVCTSNSALGSTDKKTGMWLEEYCAPYFTFKDAGHSVTVASPKGGAPPIDAGSEADNFLSAYTKRHSEDEESKQVMATTTRLDTVNAAEYDAVFFPGGHGPLWDLVEDPVSISLIEAFWAAGKPVASVCHGVACLKNAKGKRMTAFTNAEEAAVGLTAVVPFLIEDTFKALGADFRCGADWACRCAVVPFLACNPSTFSEGR
ncbi:ThiJ/PfpI family protein [Baffinella frigidus]|nr:ThiJ/PfpI family protein [Cryptophyta sp. CCMP2293]